MGSGTAVVSRVLTGLEMLNVSCQGWKNLGSLAEVDSKPDLPEVLSNHCLASKLFLDVTEAEGTAQRWTCLSSTRPQTLSPEDERNDNVNGSL